METINLLNIELSSHMMTAEQVEDFVTTEINDCMSDQFNTRYNALKQDIDNLKNASQLHQTTYTAFEVTPTAKNFVAGDKWEY